MPLFTTYSRIPMTMVRSLCSRPPMSTVLWLRTTARYTKLIIVWLDAHVSVYSEVSCFQAPSSERSRERSRVGRGR